MNLFKRARMLHRLLRYRWSAEKAELRFMLNRTYRGGSVLDIGAHRGVYSYWMHRQFTDGTRIVAFEPQRELVEHLLDFKQTFHLDRLDIARCWVVVAKRHATDAPSASTLGCRHGRRIHLRR